MSDIWVSAFMMIKPTDEQKKKVGEMVLQALCDKWNENQKAEKDKYGCSPYTEITVGTS